MLTSYDLKSIVDAVPSFRGKWNELIDTIDPPLLPMEFSMALSRYLCDQAAKGDFKELESVFAALESVFSENTSDKNKLYETLTMGFLEDLIHKAELSRVDLALIANCIKGERTRKEWNM